MNRRRTEFARVYEEHIWHVYGFFAYRVRDRDLAEDLTQLTFERALRAWSRFDRRRGPERTWLLAIARNIMIDHYRRRRSERLEPLGQAALAEIQAPDAEPGASAELLEALSQLAARDREVLALRYGADLTGPEIAALLGLTLANVQQIASRALRKLRELLKADYSVEAASTAPSATRSNPAAR
jgi:RNA polymerase sigma-70 factor, ECF subfamily